MVSELLNESLYPSSRLKNDWTTNTNSQKHSVLHILTSIQLSALEDSAFRLDKLFTRSLISAASVFKLADEAFNSASSWTPFWTVNTEHSLTQS